MYVHLATVVATEASTTGDGPLQLDVGDIGASVIEHLPAGVSAQCELYAVHVYVCMYACMYVCMYVCIHVCMCVCTYVCTHIRM